jgi:hypothetical protein
LPNIRGGLQSSKGWEDKNLHHPAGAIIDAVLSIPGVKKDSSDENKSDGFDQNGWQWDWWQDFTHQGKRYTLSGSGFYGGHSFNLADE